jgi:hypothetical protein
MHHNDSQERESRAQIKMLSNEITKMEASDADVEDIDALRTKLVDTKARYAYLRKSRLEQVLATALYGLSPADKVVLSAMMSKHVLSSAR